MSERVASPRRALRIVILGVEVKGTKGGAEVLIEKLETALLERGHHVERVLIPFIAEPKQNLVEQMHVWRSLELERVVGKEIDLVIATKFPSYLVRHPRKITWLIHQHRQLYDLYDSRFGDFSTSTVDEAIRQLVAQTDLVALTECMERYTISARVGERLRRYHGLESRVIMPPLPLSGRYRAERADNYLLYVGRVCSIKRVDLIIKALPMIDESLTLHIVGIADEPGVQEFLDSEIAKHHLHHRVQFLGRVDDEELLSLYAKCFAVFYAPYDEDYGFVTLEAMASGKPVITATDSGSVLDFVRDGVNGLSVQPIEKMIADGINLLFSDRALYQSLCDRAAVTQLPSSWEAIASTFEQIAESHN